MKSFLMKISNEDKISFVDSDDRAVFKRLLSSFKSKGISQYKITVESIDEQNLTEKQVKLFRVLISKIAEKTGNNFDIVEKTLVEEFLPGKNINIFSKSEFSAFMNWVVPFCADFFSIEIGIDKNGFIEIK